jgi:hypothetical protein
MGSENGMPSSIMSAPELSSSLIIFFVVPISGSPAVMKAMKPFFFSALSPSNNRVILFFSIFFVIWRAAYNSKLKALDTVLRSLSPLPERHTIMFSPFFILLAAFSA